VAVDSAVLDVRPDKSYVRTTAGSDCWYVNGHLCDFEMSWLIDTGASPNVLDRRSYECISSHIRPTLHPVTNSLQAAEGSALKVYGQANFVMYIDSQEFTVDFVVADLNDIQGILGMEFLSQCSCIIDACNGELKIGPLHIAMKKWDGPTCSSIKVSKYVTVLPGTEKVIFGTFDNSKWDTDSKLGIVESLNSFTNSVGVMVTDAVVELNGPEVLLTATNFGDEQAMQKEDHAIQKVVSWKESGGRRPSRVELLSESNDVRDYCGLWSSLVLIDGVLYRRWRPKCVNRDCFQLIVSSKIREDILKQLHDSRTAGHLGHKRSLMKVRQRFFWPRCKQDVIRWCRQCSVCARTKPGPRFRAKLQQLPVRNKLDRVALDILGELPEIYSWSLSSKLL